jgi:hypothetical protein
MALLGRIKDLAVLSPTILSCQERCKSSYSCIPKLKLVLYLPVHQISEQKSLGFSVVMSVELRKPNNEAQEWPVKAQNEAEMQKNADHYSTVQYQHHYLALSIPEVFM